MPPVGQLELAGLARQRPREGPALVAEELALEQRAGQRRAVDLDEGARAPRRRLVHRARDDLLADAALALDQHRHVGVGDLLEQGAHLRHGATLPEGSVEGAVAAGGLARGCAAQRPLEGALQLLLLEGLVQEVRGAELHRLDDGRGLADHREHHHREAGRALAQTAQRLEAVEAGHHHVEQHHVGRGAARRAARGRCGRRRRCRPRSRAARAGWRGSCARPRSRRPRGCGEARRARAHRGARRRHGERKAAAAPGRVADLDRAAVGLDDALADREAEPEAALAPVGAAHPGPEDPLALGGRDAGPVVRHRHLDEAGADAPRRHLDRAALRRVADRVADQVGEHLLDAQRVEARARRIRREPKIRAQTALLEERPQELDDAAHGGLEGGVAHLEGPLPHRLARGLDQVADEGVEPATAALGLAEETPLLGVQFPDALREQQVVEARDHRERGAQLVAHDRDELLALGDLGGEARAQPLELALGLGEPALRLAELRLQVPLLPPGRSNHAALPGPVAGAPWYRPPPRARCLAWLPPYRLGDDGR